MTHDPEQPNHGVSRRTFMTTAGAVVLLALMLLMNAMAILIRNRYQ